MKKYSTIRAVLILAVLSGLIYAVQFFLFRDWRDTAFYMLQDWAFLPIQVALVTIIAGKIISDRERETRLEKTRMLAGSFFSELGSELLCRIKPAVRNGDEIARLTAVGPDWTARDFTRAADALRAASPQIECGAEDFAALGELLAAKRMPVLVIASNPALLEHEDFTDMLWAVFHLTDELATRGDPAGFSAPDAAHLDSDVQRVLTETLVNWVCHMEHLKKEYPYLFRLELRRNPFTRR